MFQQHEIQPLLQRFDAQTLTFYLHTDPGHQPNQNTPPAWQIFIKTHLRELEQTHGLANEPAWAATLDHFNDYMRAYSPSTQTLACFANADMLKAYELPIALKNSAAWGKPNIMPLLWALDEYERYLVLLVDRQQARFLTAHLGRAQETDSMTIDLDYDWGDKTLMPAAGSDGTALRVGQNRERFDDMIDAHVARFHKTVAQQADEYMGQLRSRRLILGGTERAAHAVRAELHGKTANQVVDVLPIPIQTPAHDVLTAILPSATAYERTYETSLLTDIVDTARAGGAAALGTEAVQQALTLRQVQQLLLPYDVDHGDAQAMVEATLSGRGHIELVRGQAADQLAQVGGVAAALYYSL